MSAEKKRISTAYPEGFCEYVAAIAPGKPRKEIVKLVNEHYGTAYTHNQVVAYMKNHKIRNGLDGRIPKGGDWRTYLPREYPKNSGQFQKGSTPHNTCEIGERRLVGGYWWVKLGDKRKAKKQENWIPVHRLIYEQHYGPIPEGKLIIFLDGNRENLDIKNLKAVSNAELGTMNQMGLIYENADLTEVGLNIAKMKILIGEKYEQYSKD